MGTTAPLLSSLVNVYVEGVGPGGDTIVPRLGRVVCKPWF